MDRRDFIKNSAAWAAATAIIVPSSGRAATEVRLEPGLGEDRLIEAAVSVRPSPRQLKWQRREYAMFVNFGMNTFTGKEWGDGTELPSLFNPTALDARQWARIARAAGMSGMIVNAKHHDGFCLWPTAFTAHSVKASPWRDGQGDVVGEAARACADEGITFGVYLSPWDRHEPTYGSVAYNDFYLGQLTELLTNYGPIVEVWMDGAGRGDEFERMKGLYQWERYFERVRDLQPGAVISINGPDVRWVGNESGLARDTEWSVVPSEYDPQAKDLGSREQLRKAAARGDRLGWRPAQVDVSIRPGWFYHRWQDLLVRSVPNLTRIWFDSVGSNAQLLLNVPPDRRGLINEIDAGRLTKFREVRDRLFADDLARGARIEASAAATGHGPEAAVDGDPDTWWTTSDGVDQASLELDLGGEKSVGLVKVMEAIGPEGQRVEEFGLDVWDGRWREVAQGTTIGYERLLKFHPVKTARVRLRIERSRLRPTLSGLGLYGGEV